MARKRVSILQREGIKLSAFRSVQPPPGKPSASALHPVMTTASRDMMNTGFLFSGWSVRSALQGGKAGVCSVPCTMQVGRHWGSESGSRASVQPQARSRNSRQSGANLHTSTSRKAACGPSTGHRQQVQHMVPLMLPRSGVCST